MIFPSHEHIRAVIHASVLKDEMFVALVTASVLGLDVLEVGVGLGKPSDRHEMVLKLALGVLEGLVLGWPVGGLMLPARLLRLHAGERLRVESVRSCACDIVVNR